MDHFDELIKEKAEKKVFKYKPFFWLLFAKSAGITAYSAVQIIAGIVVITSIVGGATYLGVKGLSESKVNIPTPKNTETIVFKQDTIIPNEPKVIDTIEFVEKTAPEISKINHQKPKVEKPQISELEKTKTNPVQDTVLKKKTNKNPYEGWRIMTINPDTILTND
jgi:hypothetical protein